MAKKIELSDRVEKLAEPPAYVTLMEHKNKFRSNPPCRLIKK